MRTGCIGDMRALGIIEPLKVKRHVLIAAAGILHFLKKKNLT